MTEIVEWIVESFNHDTQSIVTQKFSSYSEAENAVRILKEEHRSSMVNIQKSVKKLLVE